MERSCQIIGILNTTPDSYYDGGRFDSVQLALQQAQTMLREGADIIEVGGESTGPGSKDISVEEELERVLPVITAIKKKFPDAKVAIDTYRSQVAQAALNVGVCMVNDVTAGRWDSDMFVVLKNSDCSLVLLYSKDPTPRTTMKDTQYNDVIATIKIFLQERKQAAMESGISEDRIILDPGMGHFVSSDPQYSFEIIARLREFAELGSPILLSPSRKSFLAGSDDLPPADRLPGTVASSAVAVLNGAKFVRTHDVEEVRRGCEVAIALSQ